MPLAMASMFAVIFSPVATPLEPYVGGLISAALIVLTAVVTLVTVGYFLTVELTEVAVVTLSMRVRSRSKIKARIPASYQGREDCARHLMAGRYSLYGRI
jgi:predicted PurR-regulated permease PerM